MAKRVFPNTCVKSAPGARWEASTEVTSIPVVVETRHCYGGATRATSNAVIDGGDLGLSPVGATFGRSWSWAGWSPDHHNQSCDALVLEIIVPEPRETMRGTKGEKDNVKG